MTNLAPTEASSLVRTWARLCRGSVRIVRTFSDPERHHIELARADGQRVPHDALGILLPVLLGKAQKVVATESLRSNATVTAAATSVLRQFGLTCRPNNVPMLTVMMAHAASRSADECFDDSSADEASQNPYLLSVPRPETWLSQVLTSAEQRVIGLRVDGYSHDEVAHLCRVSKRTVANQIASAYRKLGVSARLELMNRVLDGVGARHSSVRGLVPALVTGVGFPSWASPIEGRADSLTSLLTWTVASG